MAAFIKGKLLWHGVVLSANAAPTGPGGGGSRTTFELTRSFIQVISSIDSFDRVIAQSVFTL